MLGHLEIRMGHIEAMLGALATASLLDFPRKLLLEPSLSELSHARRRFGSGFIGGGLGGALHLTCVY